MAKRVECIIKGNLEDRDTVLAEMLSEISSARLREIFDRAENCVRRRVAGAIHGVLYEELGWTDR